MKQFKIAVGDEAALDEMSTHLTAARILIQQPSDNNTPKTFIKEMQHQRMINTPSRM